MGQSRNLNVLLIKGLAALALCLISEVGFAERLKTVYSPFTSKLDYITRIDTNTIIPGSGIAVSGGSNGTVTVSANGIVSPGTFTWTNSFGINVSTLVVQTLGSTAYEATFSTSTASYHVAISTNGHLLAQGGAPTISACGAAPNGSVVGNDVTGVITVGGGVVTSCVLTFQTPYEINAPACFVNDRTNILFTEATTTASAMTIQATATFGGDSISYFCIGRQ